MKDLLQYNAFGLIRISRHTISVTITAVTENNIPRTNTYTEDQIIEDIEDGIELLATWAAYLQTGKSRVTIHEIIPDLEMEWKLSDIPQAYNAIEDIVEKTKKAVGIPK